MDDFVHVSPPLSLSTQAPKTTTPSPVLWTKEMAEAPGPWNGSKNPDQLVVKAEYGAEVMQLDMVEGNLEYYTWNALKSKVSY